MHIANRAAVGAVLLAGLLPLLCFALLASEERGQAERAFRGALDQAQQEYQRTRSLPALQRLYAAQVKEESARVPALMREKRALRLKMARLHSSILSLERRYGLEGDGTTQWKGRGEEITAVLKHLRATAPVFGTKPVGLPFFRRILVSSLGDVLTEDLTWGTLSGTFTAITQVEAQRTSLAALEQTRSSQSVLTLEAVSGLERAQRGFASTTAQLAQIQETMREVHEQVLAMQGALARIDAKIRSRVERELLEKGLLTPGTIDRTALPTTPQFAWPAYGPASAGFLDPGYQERFGIPHYGMDIVLGQGSPVFSAADGVVFLARDGGAHGYSYVLIGHRGGTATLYGHLSKITVTTGQDLRQGEAVGLSGGAVGAYGSGPTTTGSHLHFEVIVDGTNVNPRNLLP